MKILPCIHDDTFRDDCFVTIFYSTLMSPQTTFPYYYTSVRDVWPRLLNYHEKGVLWKILGLGTLFEKPAHLILMQAARSQGKRFAVWSAYGKTTLPRPVRNANRSKNTLSRRTESCGWTRPSTQGEYKTCIDWWERSELSLKRSDVSSYPPISPHRPSLIAKLKAISTANRNSTRYIVRVETFESSGDYARFMDASFVPSVFHRREVSAMTFWVKGGEKRM